MMMQGKVVVVTGASMGIGEEVARICLEQRASVVLASRSQERVEAARQRLGGRQDNSLAVACDVRLWPQIDNLVKRALECFGRIDLWVNCAGYGLIDSVEKMDMDECRHLFETNLFGPIECMKAVIPVMRAQGGGAIVNVSSVAGEIAVPYMAAYSASKAALSSFTRAARLELKHTGVNVINVCPGYVRTGFAENSVWGEDAFRVAGSRKRGIDARHAAKSVLRAYEANLREVIVPWTHCSAVQLYHLIPRLVEWGMLRLLRRVGRRDPEIRAL